MFFVSCVPFLYECIGFFHNSQLIAYDNIATGSRNSSDLATISRTE
jgi:hypothetical protein